MTLDTKDGKTKPYTNRLLKFCSGDAVDLYHSTVYYARAYLIYCTDFVEQQGREPTLEECEKALRDLRWLRVEASSTSMKTGD